MHPTSGSSERPIRLSYIPMDPEDCERMAAFIEAMQRRPRDGSAETADETS